MYIFGFSAVDHSDYGWEKMFRAIVYSSGSVHWNMFGRFETYCTLNMALYPFDSQVCNISIASLAQPTVYINTSAVGANVA